MIREEYSNYMDEQEDIGVDVQPDDVDADMGGEDENAEETLRDIFDMLKDYFEGEGDDEAPEDDEEIEDVEGGDAEEEADLEEFYPAKKAVTTKGGKYGAAGYKNFSKSSGHTGFGDSKGSLNEVKRLKKLANIIK